jgi:hypothetical protein
MRTEAKHPPQCPIELDSTNYCVAPLLPSVVVLRWSLATPVLSVWACLPTMCLCMFQNDSTKDRHFVLEC